MTARDPRADPRPGDVVGRGDGRKYSVTRLLSDGSVEYTVGDGFRDFCSVDAWRNWCRGAEVVRLADPAKEG